MNRRQLLRSTALAAVAAPVAVAGGGLAPMAAVEGVAMTELRLPGITDPEAIRRMMRRRMHETETLGLHRRLLASSPGEAVPSVA